MTDSRRRLTPLLAIVVVPLISTGCLYRYHDSACKQRGADYRARVEKLKSDAHTKLTIGTKKDAIIRFFAENGIPVTISHGDASGTIKVIGCAPSGCGSDDGFIGLRVQVNDAGTVVSEPQVGAFYTNCL